MHARSTAILVVLVALALPALGSQSFLGSFSGNIITPDAVVAPQGTWEASFHSFVELFGNDDDLTSIGLLYGAAPNLEVGVAFLNDGSSDAVFSAKLQLAAETADRPAFLVGVFDAAGSADWINNDPSFFLAVSKNITPFASDVVDEPSKPLRLTAGFGSGVFDGFYAGLDWTLQQRLSLMAEFMNEGFQGNSQFNAGLRLAASDAIRLDVATLDFDSFAFGATFTTRY
jgi:hypothetical protein